MKSKNVYIACLGLAVAAMLAGCANKTNKDSRLDPDSIESVDIGTEAASEETPAEVTMPEPSEANNDHNAAAAHDNRYGAYYSFMLDKAGNENAVFSPESLDSAFCVYSHLLTADGKSMIDDYLENVDYLTYTGTDVFKIANRVWVNENRETNLDNTGISDIVYKMDMSDSKKATDEKDAYVREQTDGFIDKTQSVLDSDTVFDVMNVVYFKDRWFDGNKTLSEDIYDFHNSDGSVSQVKMMQGFDGSLFKTDNAHVFSTEYAKGFIFTAILPDEGYDLSDIDFDSIAVDKVTEVDADCRFLMPEFEIKSDYEYSFADLGLNAGTIDPSVYGNNDVDSRIYQTARIKVDCEGTEASAVTEIIVKDNAVAVRELYEMTCNRPFAYYIYDTNNDDIAFIGVVNCLQ